MRAYHFLQADMKAGSGREKAWNVGEERSIKGPVVLCKKGYHSSPSWNDALRYAPGPVACIVEVSGDSATDTDKTVHRTRKLIAAVDASRELRLFACDCAERALKRERKAGREPDARSWEAVKVARRYADGKATDKELAAARAAARSAAWSAARSAAWSAAGAAEARWQRKRLEALLNPLFAEVTA